MPIPVAQIPQLCWGRYQRRNAEGRAGIDTANFERVGNFLEVVRWPDYVEMRARRAKTSEWDPTFRGISEAGNLVFLELEERIHSGGGKNTINSPSLYAFDNDGKIRCLQIYLQMKPAHAAVANNGG